MTPLAQHIAARIATDGPISIADYMAECLLHPTLGYYSTRDPFGVAGDFITAPEVSQMFGELIGLSLAQAWLDQGAPAPFTLAELGPGRGTLRADILRATRIVAGFHDAAQVHLVEASAVLRAAQQVMPSARVVLRLARNVPADGDRSDASALVGELPERPVRFLERGLSFAADVVHGQKTGHFLDQRDNRARVGARSQGARVLDVYSCTGGFSVHAAAGGARLVHSVDVNPAAIATARDNMELNRSLPAVRRCHHHDSVGDAMQVMAELAEHRRRFDVVVVDPPSFARRRSQVPTALAAYGRLTGLALDLLDPGGLLVQSSCSSRVSEAELYQAVRDAADRGGRELVEVRITGHGLDHPIGFAEGSYLSTVFARVADSRP